MDATPTGMAAVVFTMMDALMNRLTDKGLLTKDDHIAIYQRAEFSLKNADDPQMRDALALLEHLYRS
jgi:hypothetical protein